MGMTSRRPVWEQRDGEPDAAYAHFLVYRDLGPARSLDAAYAAWRRLGPAGPAAERRETPALSPANWHRESKQWSWGDRADAWDLSKVLASSKRGLARFTRLVENALGGALQDLADAGALDDPQAARDHALKVIHACGQHFTPEAIAEAVAAGTDWDDLPAEHDTGGGGGAAGADAAGAGGDREGGRAGAVPGGEGGQDAPGPQP